MTPDDLTMLRAIRALDTKERHAFLRGQATKHGLTLQQAKQNVADAAEWVADQQLAVLRALADHEGAEATFEHFADLVEALAEP